jgi:hypothetical protein
MKKLLKINLYQSHINQNEINGIAQLEFLSKEAKFMGMLFTENSYKPEKNDKLYFLPAVSVPRIKLKDLSTKLGVKTTREITDANAIFGSERTFNKITNSHWYTYCSTSRFKQYIEDAKSIFEPDLIMSINDYLESYDEEIVVFQNYSTTRIMQEEDYSFSLNDEDTENNRFIKFDSEYDYLRELLFTDEIKCKLYNEDEIIKHVNGENAVIIDDEAYNNLSNMFLSTDQDNHILAMEIMANCNYKKSLLHIELLFMDYSQTMINTGKKNHVNFKSLCSYLSKDSTYLSTSLDDVMTSLEAKGILTKENVERILKHKSGNISLSGSYKYFTIKSVSLNEEVLERMNSNFNYTLQNDYVPVVNVENMIASEEENPVNEIIIEESLTKPQYDL